LLIAFDARMYHYLGIGRVVRNLLAELVADSHGHKVVVLAGPDLPYGVSGMFRTENVYGHAYSISEQPGLSLALWRVRPDVALFPFYVTPLGWRGRVAATIADCIPDHDPSALDSGAKRVYYRALMRRAVRRSHPLFTISHHTASDIARLYGRHAGVSVVPLAPDPGVKPASLARVTGFKRRHNLEDRQYLLYLGQWRGYKNLSVVLRALALLGDRAPELVVGGGADPSRPGAAMGNARREAELRRVAEESGVGMKVVGFVPEEDLPAAYTGALAYVFPSRYEGFGLPALEAMACGTPVLAAAAGALPEVVGDRQRLLGPDDAAAWAEAIGQLTDNPGVRAEMSLAARDHAAQFSWRRAADLMLDAIEAGA
jgi:alpha-1,3-rhamnosyl/mannosyltransferase